MIGSVTWLTSGSPRALRRDMRPVIRRRLTLLLLCAFSARAAAQDADKPSPAFSCDGRIVTRIEITPGRPAVPGHGGEMARRGARRGAAPRDHAGRTSSSRSGAPRRTPVHRVPARRVGARASRPAVHRRRARSAWFPTRAAALPCSSRPPTRSPCSSAGGFAGSRRTPLSLGNANVGGQGCASRRRGSARAPIAPGMAAGWPATRRSTGRTS